MSPRPSEVLIGSEVDRVLNEALAADGGKEVMSLSEEGPTANGEEDYLYDEVCKANLILFRLHDYTRMFF